MKTTSLTTKFSLIYIPTVVITVTLLLALLEINFYAERRQALIDEVNNVADLRSIPVSRALWEFDTEALGRLNDDLSRLDSLQSAWVEDTEGKRIVQTGKPDVPPSAEELQAVRELLFSTSGKPESLGRLVITFHDDQIWAEVQRHLISNGLIVGILLITLVLASMFVSRRLVGIPLSLLQDAIEKNRKAGEPVMVNWESNDQLGVVIKAFNTLQQSQWDTEAKLKSAHDTLEQRVAERTAELEESRKEIKASEQRLLSWLDSAPIAVGITIQGRSVFNNVAYRTQFAIPEGQANGIATAQFYADPVEREAILSLLNEQGEILNREILWRRIDGTTFTGLGSYSFTEFQGEEALLFWLYDIEELKQAEARSEMARAQTMDAIESLDADLVMFDARERFVICNERYRELYRGGEDVLTPGRPYREMLERAADLRGYPEANRMSKEDWVEWRLSNFRARHKGMIQRDGERWVMLNDLPTSDGGAISLRYDITDLKRAEEEAAVFKRFADASRQGFGMADLTGRTTYVNPKLLEILKAESPDHLIGQPIEHFYPESIRHRLRDEVLAEVNETGEWTGELMLQGIDGSTTPTLESFFLLRDDEGNPQSYADIMTDITEAKRAEEELQRARDAAEAANQAKSDFLANMSHEIRTPMNAVIGLSHLALGTDLNRRQRDYLEKIENSANNLLGIINDILDFSKIEAGKLDMESIHFDLHAEVIDNLANVVGLKASEKDLELLFDFDADLPFALTGDPLRLGQVLINLSNNAVKFTEEGNITLAIRCLSSDNEQVRLRFEVRDTGIGMNEEQCSRLFKSFSQADTSTTRKYGGTGLGLAISKSLVGLMDGEIGVESAPGEGSVFWFTARFGLAPEATLKQATDNKRSLDRLKVLVVDDNPSARVILLRYLDAFGHEAEEAESGEAAITALRSADRTTPFNLVLMDWRMPGMNGIEATRVIKNESSLANTPAVMMVTAFDRDQLLNASKDIELDGVLVKPVSPSTLLDGMLEAFGKQTGKRRVSGKPVLDDKVKGAHLLLVEDNEINQQVASEILEGAGVRITIANDGRQGLERIQRDGDQFDGVLMDIQMPVMDGYTAAREIRQLAAYGELPIIAMTANAMTGDREKALNAGMNDHVAKPIDVANLFEVLDRWIVAANPAAPDQIAPESPPGEEDDDLPELPGLDTEAGLQRVNDNRGLYRKLLRKFAASQADAIDRIESAMNDGDSETAEREAHTLKGVAGNIGAGMLAQAAKNLEVTIRGQDDIASLLQPARAALSHVLESLTLLDAPAQSNVTETGDSAPTDPQAMRSRLHDLKLLLADDDSESQDCLDAILERFPNNPFEHELTQIGRLIDDYDFEAALRVLNGLAETAGLNLDLV